MQTTPSIQGTALITGASSGIGAVYADRLARRGYDLILVARDLAKLNTIAERVGKSSGRQVELIGADLATLAGQQRIADVLGSDPRVKLLLNNAGVGATRPLIESDMDRMDRMIQLNVTAVTCLAHAAAASFAARGHGVIINIASIVALAPELLNGVYGASKAYVLALSQSMHHELVSKGVQIQAVLPGATSTDFWDTAGRPLENLPVQIVMTAQDMVDAALAGLDRGELVTIPSLPDAADWERFDAARKALGPNLSHSLAADRYRTALG